MKLKVCGMRSLENAQDLIDKVQPDWMGMIFYSKSARFVSEEAHVALGGLPVNKVGVFVDASLEEIQKCIMNFGLTTIQLHGDESVAFTKDLKAQTGLEIFKVFAVKESIDWRVLEPYLPIVDYFLFDTFTKAYGGSGQVFDWHLLENYPFDKPFLLSGGLSIENVTDIKRLQNKLPQLVGLDINSKFEIEPAMKDIEKIREFKELVNN
ncbi:phosphoribosylanthranilate isomerase [Belliella buryatensis]|uniref:N-(5'-phosphoribosyl)anthranilate isomerase n=1 Tax=Belliella buryatensis TaxID=1500549 RepID=A0A239CN33_9BACT|nr:phosphoribosylanthranilate isomerase [Belliella buryatensis]SNS21091.1 phosphoribosylanthranilate isomerase [Belliella buryatensis]